MRDVLHRHGPRGADTTIDCRSSGARDRTDRGKECGDIDLYVDWCVEAGADSGIYLKNTSQIQIWFNAVGSGGLYNNQTGPRNPLVVADHAAERWNTFHIGRHRVNPRPHRLQP